jgi:hypothetical protein
MLLVVEPTEHDVIEATHGLSQVTGHYKDSI